MPATPQINYFKSRNGYYTQFKRRQRLLAHGPQDEPDGPTYQAAVKKFAEIMHCGQADKAEDNNLVITVLDRYAVHLRNQGRTGTLGMFLRAAESAIAEFGQLKVKELKVMHVQAWLDKMGADRGTHRGRKRNWGDTQKRIAVDKLTTALNWAVDQGMIPKNPLGPKVIKALGLRRRSSRGREYVLHSGEHEAICTAAKPYFADLLTFMEGTGCRPGEAYHATATNYDREKSAIVFKWNAQPPEYVHKTARKTEKDRVIYLSPDLVELVERRIAVFPEGLIFRNRDGNPWTNSSVYLMLKRLRTKIGMRRNMVAYSYRHTFATRWLLAGESIKVLADLLGTSIEMLEKHYGHLEVDPARLLSLLARFKEGEKTRTLPTASASVNGQQGSGEAARPVPAA